MIRVKVMNEPAISIRPHMECPVEVGILSTIVEREKDVEVYRGPYEAEPRIYTETRLETMGKKMDDNVTVKKIPMHVTRNPNGGLEVYVAESV